MTTSKSNDNAGRITCNRDTEKGTCVYHVDGFDLGKFDFCTDSRVWYDQCGLTDCADILDCLVDVPTIVIFRKCNNDDSVIAIMPELPFTDGGNDCTCYQHVGQHSGCNGWHYFSRPCDPADYADLLAELQRVGYNVRVMTTEQIVADAHTAKVAANSAQSALVAANALWECVCKSS
jgi:hypothetical protein